jgi:polyisoprenoid-binding protein YceI
MMKNIFILTAIIFSGTGLFAQQYAPVDAGSSVKFAIKNFGLNVDGSFKGLQGKITFRAENLATSLFNVSVDAATVNTGNGSRDGHLKKGDYFDVAKYPRINFASTKITAGGKSGQYIVEGTFTIKGISKTVSFPFAVSSGASGNLFTGKFKINRRDFKVGGNSLVLSDDVTVTLNVSTVKQ